MNNAATSPAAIKFRNASWRWLMRANLFRF